MGDFKKAYSIGRVNEGGYVNRADDKGGETYCGVSRKWHPNWDGWEIVDAVKTQRPLERGDIIEDAQLEQLLETFYRVQFWEQISGDQIEKDSVAAYIYDWCLTSGGARKAIQEELELVADGVFGPKTLAAINAGGAGMLTRIRDARIRYYYALVRQDPANMANAKGWMNRAVGLYKS
jgi:lysozyme family protein